MFIFNIDLLDGLDSNMGYAGQWISTLAFCCWEWDGCTAEETDGTETYYIEWEL